MSIAYGSQSICLFYQLNYRLFQNHIRVRIKRSPPPRVNKVVSMPFSNPKICDSNLVFARLFHIRIENTSEVVGPRLEQGFVRHEPPPLHDNGDIGVCRIGEKLPQVPRQIWIGA